MSKYTSYFEATHLVIDIETLGLSKDAPIIQVSAVMFDTIKSGYVGYNLRYFDESIDITTNHQIKNIELDTLLWHLKENNSNLIKILEESSGSSDEGVLLSFFEWIESNRNKDQPLFIWGNSPDFDIDIIDRTMDKIFSKKKFSVNYPKMRSKYKFYQFRDVRTLTSCMMINDSDVTLNPLKFFFTDNSNLQTKLEDLSESKKHYALYDALVESAKLINMFNIIKGANNNAGSHNL